LNISKYKFQRINNFSKSNVIVNEVNFRAPPVQWAQRKDNVYVTVPLRDFCEEKINITEKCLEINGKSDNKEYHAKIDLFSEVIPEESKTQILGFQV